MIELDSHHALGKLGIIRGIGQEIDCSAYQGSSWSSGWFSRIKSCFSGLVQWFSSWGLSIDSSASRVQMFNTCFLMVQ